MLHQHRITIYWLLGLGLAGYVLPWIVAPTAPLTLNAFDLAEWTSLHPTQFGTPLLVPLLLRLQLPIITVLVALLANKSLMKLLAAVIILSLSVAQLPPLEFLTISRHDSNYQQQFLLAAISLIAGLTLLRWAPSRRLALATGCLAAIGLLASLVGQSQAQLLYQMSLQEGVPGVGLGVLAVAYFGMIALALSTARLREKFMKLIEWLASWVNSETP